MIEKNHLVTSVDIGKTFDIDRAHNIENVCYRVATKMATVNWNISFKKNILPEPGRPAATLRLQGGTLAEG